MDMRSSNNGSARTVDWERRETLREESRWRRREEARRKDATVASSFCSFWRGIDGGAAVD